jgi:hypothetical protein
LADYVIAIVIVLSRLASRFLGSAAWLVLLLMGVVTKVFCLNRCQGWLVAVAHDKAGAGGFDDAAGNRGRASTAKLPSLLTSQAHNKSTGESERNSYLASNTSSGLCAYQLAIYIFFKEHSRFLPASRLLLRAGGFLVTLPETFILAVNDYGPCS